MNTFVPSLLDHQHWHVWINHFPISFDFVSKQSKGKNHSIRQENLDEFTLTRKNFISIVFSPLSEC